MTWPAGGYQCFCGVWVAAKNWHRFITGHEYIAARKAKFTPEDYRRRAS